MDLKNRVVLITGGARIGKIVAKALVDKGSHLVLIYRHSKQSAQECAQYARLKRRKVILIQADLTDKDELAIIIPQIKRQIGRLDVLVNMASTFDQKSLAKLTWDDWDWGLDTNLKHVFRLSLDAARLMKENGSGKIINFADWTSISHRPRYTSLAPYYVAKAGVSAVTEVLALGLAPQITVNAIAPGPILAPSGLTKREHREVVQATPLKRWGGSEEITKAVLFLIESEFVTGETIRVDGGRHLH